MIVGVELIPELIGAGRYDEAFNVLWDVLTHHNPSSEITGITAVLNNLHITVGVYHEHA